MLERRLRGEAVVLVAMTDLPPPSERAGELPARRDVVGIERACRPAFLVDARLELFGVDEMPPAALQRQRAGGIPGDSNRGRVQRPRFDVPAVLVGFAGVEAACLDLHPVEHQAGGE